MVKIEQPYGLWPSPLTPSGMAGALRLDGVAFDSDGRRLVWLEGRSGQGVLVTTVGDEAPRDVTVEGSVRARVGYGGGDFAVQGGLVFFVGDGGRLYRQSLDGGGARPITPAFGQCSSPTPSPDGRWLLYVHSDEGVDCLAVVDTEGQHWPRRLVTGHDFVMWPRWSPAGDAIAYVSWEHPAMPWDSTTLWLAPVTSDPAGPTLGPATAIAGGPTTAVGQPEFAPDGRSLAYLADATGWNQLYLRDLATGQVRQLTDAPADHGGAAWAYEPRFYAWSQAGQSIVYRRDEGGQQSLWRLVLASGESQPVPGPLGDYVTIDSLVASPTSDEIAFIGSTASLPRRVIAGEPTSGRAHVWRRSTPEQIAPAALATPTPCHWRADGGATAHGLYYPPTSQQATASGPAPLIVLVHGGPTSQAQAGYSAQAQFLATRGYAVLAVNYRGSTGHGRAYMDLLRGNWGVYDVEDCVAGARHLIDQGLAHPEQLVIMGGSAGGFTVLQAMVMHPRFFRAGVCLYGVADHFALAADTHKFEAHYLDSLLGPLPAAAALYRERSPLFHADRIVQPMAVFQGEDDQVVPRAQSDAIVESLRRRGILHEYHLYPGEGHGWRRRETIEHFYRALESFLRRVVIYA